MKALLGLLVLAAGGCSWYVLPTPNQLRDLGLSRTPPEEHFERERIRMSLDSPWLSGDFEGVLVARRGGPRPAVRAQLFGDLGPKALDVLARPDRIVGYFPQALTGVDCSLPREAVPDPIVFLGVTLLEEFAERSEDRVLGIREEAGGMWVLLKSEVEGLEVVDFVTREHRWTRRRFHWMHGVVWDLDRGPEGELRISEAGVRVRVKVLDRNPGASRTPGLLDLALPAEVRVVAGSRK